MEPMSIAAACTAVLLASKAGEGFGQEAGRAAWTSLSATLARIRRTAEADADTGAALATAERAPEDGAALRELTARLLTLATRDPDLAEELAAVPSRAGTAAPMQYAERIVNTNFNDRVEVRGDLNIG